MAARAGHASSGKGGGRLGAGGRRACCRTAMVPEARAFRGPGAPARCCLFLALVLLRVTRNLAWVQSTWARFQLLRTEVPVQQLYPRDPAVNSDPHQPLVSGHSQVFGYLLHCMRSGSDPLGVNVLVFHHFRS